MEKPPLARRADTDRRLPRPAERRQAFVVSVCNFKRSPIRGEIQLLRSLLPTLTTGTPYIMESDDFEWDDDKAANNRRLHKITFEQAREAFADPFIIEWIDEGQDEHEQRFSALGMVENRLLFVAYTMRGSAIRIISARPAEPFERRRYHEENQT